MDYYFIVRLKITDENVYNNYLEACDDVFKKYNGKYLAVDNKVKSIEGSYNDDRTVIIQFNNKKDFNDWYYSKEYQDILKHRLEGADCKGILVEGK